MNREEELTMVKMINFANEFLKVSHDLRKEADHPNQLPDEIQEYLANSTLDDLMKSEGLEPEMLVWGLVNIVEILLKFTKMNAEELTDVISVFVSNKREELNG